MTEFFSIHFFKMEKKRKDDLVFLVPEPPARQNHSHLPWFLLLTGISILFLSLAGYFYTRSNFKLVRLVVDIDQVKNPVCSGIADQDKFDCHPEASATEDVCQQRGCCYNPVGASKTSDFPPLKVPWCFYPSDYAGYVLGKVLQDGKDIRATLKRNTPSGFPHDIQILNLVVSFIDDSMIRVKVRITCFLVYNFLKNIILCFTSEICLFAEYGIHDTN